MKKYNFDRVIELRNKDCYKWDQVPNDVIPMSVATMDFESPKEVVDVLIERAKHGLFGYVIPTNRYNNSIIQWEKKRHNWDIKEEWLDFALGTSPILSMIVRDFTNPGDNIIVQTPVYGPFYSITKNNGRQIVENKMSFENGKYIIDFEDLEEKAKNPRTTMMILCNPHNPVGRVWNENELRRIGEICIKNHVLIFSDDVHCEFVYSGHKYTPIATLSKEIANNTITCCSPSKTFNLGGMFNGFVVIPNKQLHERYKLSLATSRLEGTVFGMQALEAAYMHGEDYLEELLEYLEGNFKYLEEFINTNIPKIKIIKPEGTFVVWMDCREFGMSAEELGEIFEKKAKVSVSNGKGFGEEGRGFIRLNIGCRRVTLEEALNRIDKVLHKK